MDLVAAVERGRPQGYAGPRRPAHRTDVFKALWAQYSFHIVVVLIAFVLLAYTVAG